MKKAKKPIVLLAKTLCTVLAVGAFASQMTSTCAMTETLPDVILDENAKYNGIVVPEDWNYKVDNTYGYRPTIPYLVSADEGGYAPEIINIDKGRQLFVDNFLIEDTDLTQTYHTAETREEPVLRGDESWENTTAFLASGGVWYDMDEKLYKCWYVAGFCGTTAYATSEDGIHWTKPSTASDGSNLILRSKNQIAGNSVWIDYNAPQEQRYKMLLRQRNGVAGYFAQAELYVSSNGILWKPLKDDNGNIVKTGRCEDRSTFFHDDLNDNWVISIRDTETVRWNNKVIWNIARCRAYNAAPDLITASQWNFWKEEEEGPFPYFWQKTDGDDPIDTTQGDHIPELYSVDCIAYESIMIGMQQIWYGPENDEIEKTGWTKITELQASFSRDGFYYDRPKRGIGEGNAFIPASREKGTWDYGYVSPATGGIIVDDDEIRIYYAAIASEYTDANGNKLSGAYVGGSISYATIRRDGFASMDGSGTLTTKPLTATKDVRYLFVNAKVPEGSIKAEILTPDGNVLEGYSAEDCVAFTGDSCCTMLTWKNAESLSFLQGKGFRIRFIMENGEFYSFWLSADTEGASGGCVGAGYVGTKDLNPTILPEDNNSSEKKGLFGCKSSTSPIFPMLALIPATAIMLHRRKRKSH